MVLSIIKNKLMTYSLTAGAVIGRLTAANSIIPLVKPRTGVYFVRLVAGDAIVTRKKILTCSK